MKRLWVLVLLALITGGILIAVSFTPPLSLTEAELSAIKSNCSRCHNAVQTNGEGDIRTIHSLHNGFECVVCHKGSAGSPGDDEEEDDFEDVSRTVCADCHSQPVYTSASQMHDAHSTTDCSVCHGQDTGYTSAKNAHDIMRNIGVGLVAVVIAGLVLNFVVAGIRLRHHTGDDSDS